MGLGFTFTASKPTNFFASLLGDLNYLLSVRWGEEILES